MIVYTESMASSARTKQAIAGDVWEQLLRVTRLQRDRLMRIAAELELSPGDMRTLLTLDDPDGRPMGELARTWHCDASEPSWIGPTLAGTTAECPVGKVSSPGRPSFQRSTSRPVKVVKIWNRPSGGSSAGTVVSCHSSAA